MDTQSTDIKLVPCPVCDKFFEKLNIEQHVNKCIFLNSSSENTSKRDGSHLEGNSVSKKARGSISSSSSTSTSENVQSVSEEDAAESTSSSSIDHKPIPLAESMRPNSLDDIVGQTDSFGPGSMLHTMLVKKKISNMILWGPPGCGKTSIANVIANICKEENNLRFVKLSATMSGVNDVKEAVKIAKNEASFKRQTVMFMDEIHRFNKLQQDTFLPHVENGTIILIGATTENPSFSLNNALLSRCRVVALGKLTVDEVWQILERAVLRKNLAVIIENINDKILKEYAGDKCLIERRSIRWLAEVCDGDARIALSALELVVSSGAESSTKNYINFEDLKQAIKRSHMLYDRKGDEHFNIVSAIQKSIRSSDENAALYWTTRALHSGEDPLYIARRLIRAAAEDIGLGDPNALVEAVACLEGCKHIGAPESDALLVQCAVRLARAEKCHEVYHAMKRAQRSLKEATGPLPPIPLHLRNTPTRLLRDLGFTKHRHKTSFSCMPEGMENINFFNFNTDC